MYRFIHWKKLHSILLIRPAECKEGNKLNISTLISDFIEVKSMNWKKCLVLFFFRGTKVWFFEDMGEWCFVFRVENYPPNSLQILSWWIGDSFNQFKKGEKENSHPQAHTHKVNNGLDRLGLKQLFEHKI